MYLHCLDCSKSLLPLSTSSSLEGSDDNQGMDTSDSTWGSKSDRSIVTPQKPSDGDLGIKLEASPQHGRSIMASRWATNEVPKPSSKSPSLSPTSSLRWLNQRDDLFSGAATVNNASATLFESMSTRNEKKAIGKDVKESHHNQRSHEGREMPPHLAVRRSDVVPKARSRVTLTGANITAGEGDNGWGTRMRQGSRGGYAAAQEAFPVRGAGLGEDASSRSKTLNMYDHHSAEESSAMGDEEKIRFDGCNEGLLESITRLQLQNVELLKSSARLYGDHDEPTWD